jgi:hypothetical protein
VREGARYLDRRCERLEFLRRRLDRDHLDLGLAFGLLGRCRSWGKLREWNFERYRGFRLWLDVFCSECGFLWLGGGRWPVFAGFIYLTLSRFSGAPNRVDKQ